MKAIVRFVFLSLLLATPALAQVGHLQRLDQKLQAGEKPALAVIGAYFDSNKKVVEFLGYHRIETTEDAVARRIVAENSLFAPGEVDVAKAPRREFLNFLRARDREIVFSTDLNAFLVTPIERRAYVATPFAVDDGAMKGVEERVAKLFQEKFLTELGLDGVYLIRDPKVLFELAEALYRNRNRYNVYHFDRGKYVDTLRFMTGLELQVADERGRPTIRPENAYDDATLFNIAAFFAANYRKFEWDRARGRFVAASIAPEAPSEIRRLVTAIYGEDDDAARAAFLALTERPSAEVADVIEEFSRGANDPNRTLPTFATRFVVSLARLTEYCRANGVSWKASGELRARLERLRDENLGFGDRYRLENETAAALGPDEVTAFEYFAAVHENEWDFTYSAGRILDIFYTRNWDAIVADDARLRLFLAKAGIFKGFGIIGICGDYPRKFATARTPDDARLRRVAGNDRSLLEVVAKIAELRAEPAPSFAPDKWDADMTSVRRADFAERLAALLKDGPELSKEAQDEAIEIVSNASYDQIGAALDFLGRAKFNYRGSYFRFALEDFGFDFAGDLEKPDLRAEFRALVENYGEAALHRYYLDREGLVYKTPAGALDYDAIYEMLRFDVVTPFAGGGGGTRDDNVYPLVKLLEKEFGTTLGFPDKRCRSRVTYGCSPKSRARSWMLYLREKKLLRQPHDGPESFGYSEGN